MSVKRSQSVLRALAVIDLIAERQPIGVSAIAKHLGVDRMAVQRITVSLADAGWIRMSSEPPTRWELTEHLFTIANSPYSSARLRDRARPVLNMLREETGETTFLAVPDGNKIILVEVAESRLALRMTARLGQIVDPLESATGRALLPYFNGARQAMMLGRAPTDAEAAQFAATRERGYSISDGDVIPGTSNVAVPIFDGHPEPAGALVVTGPSNRLTPERQLQVGELLVRSAKDLGK